MNRYQGEDIPFSINIANADNDITDWEDAERVVLSLYTDESKQTKFEYKSDGSATTTGYETLTLDSSVTAKTKLNGVLAAAKTKLMHGTIFCNIYVKPVDQPAYQMLSAASTGIVIKVNLLKNESV